MATFTSGEIAGICIGSYVVFAFLLVRLVPFHLAFTKSQTLKLLRSRFPYQAGHISHRGGSFIGPENTIFTFRLGVEKFGVHMLEMDVNESRDGEIIVSHDASLERVCDAPHSLLNVIDLVVAGKPQENLPQVKRRVHLHFHSDSRSSFNADTCAYAVPVSNETRFPLLSEVFDAFPHTPIHLDIKYPSDAFTLKVIELIEQYKRESITIVGSAGTANIDSVYKYLDCMVPAASVSKRSGSVSPSSSSSLNLLRPCRRRDKFRTFSSMREAMFVGLLYYTGLLPFVPLKFDVFSIPLPSVIQKFTKNCFMRLLIKSLLHTPALWKHLQRRGILVLGWVLNDDASFEEASRWPINGIMTDDPELLQKFYATHACEEMYLL